MKQLLSLRSKKLIEVLLTDIHISEKVFENSSDREKYKNCIIQDDGTIIMGKTGCHWWNQLINSQDKIPFDSFALKVWDALVDSSSGLNNKAITEGLSREIVMNAVREKNYDNIVQRLYDCWAHVAQGSAGYQTPKENSEEFVGNPQIVSVNTPNQPPCIVFDINGIRKVIPIIDSVGDKMDFGLEFGITGIKKL